jgi:hypothetical protein
MSAVSNLEIPLMEKIALHLEPVIIVFMWCFAFFRSENKKVMDYGMIASLLLFFLLALVTTLINSDATNYQPTLISCLYILQFTVYLSIVLLIPFYIRSEKEVSNSFKMLFILYLFNLVVSLKILLSGENVSRGGAYISGNVYVDPLKYAGRGFRRLTGGWSDNANTLGGYMGSSILFYFYLITSYKKPISKIIIMGLVCISLTALIFTFSRSALLALVSASVVFLFYSKQKIPIVLPVIVCFALVSLFLVDTSAFVDRYWNSTFGRFLEGTPLIKMNPRVAMWVSRFEDVFKEGHFLYGYGFHTKMIDNLYLDILYSSGILVLLAFLSFIFTVIKKLLLNIKIGKNKFMGITALSIFVLLLVQNLFGSYYASTRIIPHLAFVGLYFSSLGISDIKSMKSKETT